MSASAVWWLPPIGLAIGILAAGMYFPLASLFLPSDISVGLAMFWQMFLGGFRAETALFRLRNHEGKEGPAEAVATLCLALLLKFMLLRQFFPSELAPLFVLGSVAAFCSPILLRGRMPRGESTLPRGLHAATWVFWIALATGVAGGNFWRFPTGEWLTLLGAPALILAFAGLTQIALALYLRERHGKLPNPFFFAAALPSEIAALCGVLSARYLFL